MQQPAYTAGDILRVEQKGRGGSCVDDFYVLDDLHLTVIGAGGMSCECLYRAGSKAAYLKAENSLAPSCRGLALIGQYYAPSRGCCKGCRLWV